MLTSSTGRCLSLLAISSRRLPPAVADIGSRRSLPARGTKPLPRYEWSQKHLDELTHGGEYTHKPLRVNRLGGRHPETGRKINQHIGGGAKFDFFMIDYDRRGPTEPGVFYEERTLFFQVLEVRRDPNRSAHIALIAGSRGKRWILATANMTAGQIIRSSCFIPDNPIAANEGDAHPLGALAPGTLVNSVMRYPAAIAPPSTSQFVYEGHFHTFIRDAGAAATVVRHQGDYTIIRMPGNKHEYALHRECQATVGQLSHADLATKIFGSANMHRRFGYMPSSGLWHKKDGYSGRKVRPLPPVRTFEKPEQAPPRLQAYSLTKDECSGLFGCARVHNLLQAGYNHRDYPP